MKKDEAAFRPREEAIPPSVLMPGMLEHLTERDLCALWRRCGDEALDAPSREARADYDRVGEECLAELRERNPEAMAAWLEGGTRSADELERLLVTDPDQTSTPVAPRPTDKSGTRTAYDAP